MIAGIPEPMLVVILLGALDDARATRVLRTVINSLIRAGQCTTEWAVGLGLAPH